MIIKFKSNKIRNLRHFDGHDHQLHIKQTTYFKAFGWPWSSSSFQDKSLSNPVFLIRTNWDHLSTLSFSHFDGFFWSSILKYFWVIIWNAFIYFTKKKSISNCVCVFVHSKFLLTISPSVSIRKFAYRMTFFSTNVSTIYVILHHKYLYIY